MNQQFKNRSLPTGNPLTNVLAIIAGIVVISLSLALGFFVFIAIAGFVLVMAAVVTVRVWWRSKRMGAKSGPSKMSRPEPSASAPRVIEGEFREVQPKDKDTPAD